MATRWLASCKQALPHVLAYGKTVPYGEKYFINYAVTFGMSKKKAQEMWDHVQDVKEKDSNGKEKRTTLAGT